jgi:hypothetical protein
VLCPSSRRAWFYPEASRPHHRDADAKGSDDADHGAAPLIGITEPAGPFA